MLIFTLAARESMFIRSSWICAAPFCCPGPTNQISEPGSPQRTSARPELSATSASMAGPMVPLALTDQPSGTDVPFLLALAASGPASTDGPPGVSLLVGRQLR